MRHAAADPPEPARGAGMPSVESFQCQAGIRVNLVFSAADVDCDEVPEVLPAQLFRNLALENGFAQVGDLFPGIVRLDHAWKLITPISPFKRHASRITSGRSSDSSRWWRQQHGAAKAGVSAYLATGAG